MDVSQDKVEALNRLHAVVLRQMHAGQGPELLATVLFEHLRGRVGEGHSHVDLARKDVRLEVTKALPSTNHKAFNSALGAYAKWLNKCRDAFVKQRPDLRPEVESQFNHVGSRSATIFGRKGDGVACVEANIGGMHHLAFLVLRTNAHSIHLAVAFRPIASDGHQKEVVSRPADHDIAPLANEKVTNGAPKATLHTCSSGSDERAWLKEHLPKAVVTDDTSNLVLAWVNVNPSFRADDARTFLLRDAAGALRMTVESVYDVYGQHDMLVKMRGDVAEKQILATLQSEMGQRGFLGPHKGNSYLKPPTVLNVIKEHVALDAPNTRRILCGIIAFVYLSDIPAAHVDDAVDLVRGVIATAPTAELIGLFQTNRDVVAEVYLACGGYYDLGRAVFAIEKQLNFTSYEAKRTTLLAMSVLEPGDLAATTNTQRV